MTVVAFVGIDGSGKTTAIERFVARNRHVRCQTISMRGKTPVVWGSALVRSVIRRAGALLGSVGMVRARALLRKLDELIDWSDRRLRLARAQRRARRGDMIVLSDRWPVDHWTLLEPTSENYRFRFRLFAKRFPLPDLVILIDLDPEMAHHRKPEYSLGAQRRKARALKWWLRNCVPRARQTSVAGDCSLTDMDRLVDQAVFAATRELDRRGAPDEVDQQSSR